MSRPASEYFIDEEVAGADQAFEIEPDSTSSSSASASLPVASGHPIVSEYRPSIRPMPRRKYRPGRKPKVPAVTVTPLTDPRDGTWLDLDLRLTGPARGQLLASVIAILDKHEARSRPRRRHHQLHHKTRVECIVANALRTHHFRASPRVAYNTSNDSYPGDRWHSVPSLRAAIRLFVAAGLLDREVGVQWSPIRDPHAATFWLTQALKNLSNLAGANASSVCKSLPPRVRLIELRSAGDGSALRRIAKFDWTDETDCWADGLERYNRFAKDHAIWIDMDARKADAALVSWFNRKAADNGSRQPGITQPEYFDCYLKRIFNDGTFEHGGRMYGAWYQRAPSWLRSRIVIDDDPTVELDFSGMSVRMLYHLEHIDYLEDPYSIAELESRAIRNGNGKDHFRESVKTIVQAMLNNEDADKKSEMVWVSQSFNPHFTRAEVKALILSKHERISHQFGKGIGKILQRLESDMAFRIVVELMDDGILALPVHDSFLVEDRHKDRLLNRMKAVYNDRLSFWPIIKESRKGKNKRTTTEGV